MSEQEKNKARRIAEIAEGLPEQEKQILLAFGEGMAAMADRQRTAPAELDAARDSA